MTVEVREHLPWEVALELSRVTRDQLDGSSVQRKEQGQSPGETSPGVEKQRSDLGGWSVGAAGDEC